MNMSDIKKLDTEEIQNKVVELKDSILKAKISKLNQGDFDSNTFNKIKKRYCKMSYWIKYSKSGE